MIGSSEPREAEQKLDHGADASWSRVDQAIAAVHSKWPRIQASGDAFRDHVSQHLACGWEEIRLEELYLAWACARGDAAALAVFEEEFFSSIDGVLRRAGLGPAASADVKQSLRIRLFVGQGDASPKIGTFSGRGGLTRWLRVIAVREAIAFSERERALSLESEDAWASVPAERQDPELVYFKTTYQTRFQDAVERASLALAPQDRNLLRLHFFEGLTIDDIGRLLRVHRATAARRILRARESLLSHARRILRRELGVDARELESILRLVESRLEISLVRVFAASSEPTP